MTKKRKKQNWKRNKSANIWHQTIRLDNDVAIDQTKRPAFGLKRDRNAWLMTRLRELPLFLSPLSLGKLPLEASEPFFSRKKRSLYFSRKLLNLSERCIFYRTVSLAPSVNTMTFPWRECACQEMVTRWPVVRMIKASNFGTWVMLKIFPWIPGVKGRVLLLQRQLQMIFLLISNIHTYCGETSVIQTSKWYSQVPALQRCWHLRRRELYEDWYLWDLGNCLQ